MFSSRRKSLQAGAVGAILLAAGATVLAQHPNMAPIPPQDTHKASPLTKPAYGNLYMSTKLGSFKMLEYNDDAQPEGHFEMSFSGTVLIDTTEAVKHNRNLTTSVKVEGNVRRELQYHGRDLYHGKGKLIVDGGWHAIEFFGEDLDAKLNGYAVFRLTGEFDKNLDTGYYWYDNGKKFDWGTGGNQPTCPKIEYGIQKPKIKINGKGG
ncbi:MAG: hypothetical protein P4L46_18175 [Fimbriimonas sp.]|nr:hypothetical protein [Fimbriimonas sp.]